MRATLEQAIDSARRVAKEIAGPEAASTDENRAWPEKAMRALQEAGLGGLVVPESLGGTGLGLEGLAQVGMELGRECASTALCFGMHCVGAAVIASKATDEHKEELLDPICAGKHLTTLALSEPGTGAHFYVPQTELIASEQGFHITGGKSFVTNGNHADSYVISARSPVTRDVGQFSCAVIDREGPGIEWSGGWTGLGMRGNNSIALTLNEHEIPPSRLLGAPGEHDYFIFEVVAPYFLVSMAGAYLGIAGSALQQATEHLTRRVHTHTGRRLASNEILQHKVGQLWARYKSARSYLEWAAREGDAGGEEALPALLARKALAGDVAVDIVNESMTLMGGKGYQDGSVMERKLRDVRAVHVMSPTADLLYMWTGRAMLGQPLIDPSEIA